MVFQGAGGVAGRRRCGFILEPASVHIDQNDPGAWEKSDIFSYPKLLSPITLAGLTLKNRIFSAPTSVSELGPGEKYSRENIEYYKLRAASGVSVVCVGEVMVDIDNGRSHPQQIGIDKPQNATVFCQMADAIHSQGAAASVELDHSGALCAPEFLGKTPAGPSAYVDEWGDEVRAMTEEEIVHTARMFGQAAANAKRYGYDMVTVHAGHGWLIHQFLSPLTNFRQDHWGGTPEKRLKETLIKSHPKCECAGN